MSQNEQILNHLRQGNSIEPLQCLEQFNCFSLRSRISEIEGKSGHPCLLKPGEVIVREWAEGNGKRWRRYRLATQQDARVA